MSLHVILAADSAHGIGFKEKLPWPHLKEDMKLFKKVTTGRYKNNGLIMGRKTHESILGLTGCPLPQRYSYVVSSTLPTHEPYVVVVRDIEEAIELGRDTHDQMWVIGGASIYRQVFENHIDDISSIRLTRVSGQFTADTRFDVTPYLGTFELIETTPTMSSSNVVFHGLHYRKKWVPLFSR